MLSSTRAIGAAVDQAVAGNRSRRDEKHMLPADPLLNAFIDFRIFHTHARSTARTVCNRNRRILPAREIGVMRKRSMSIETARRAVLAAQGFSSARPECKVNVGHIRRVVRKLGLLQLDFVNVLVPAHQLILFSRLGAYEQQCFDQAIYSGGQFTEQWAHEACIVPMTSWALLQHRRETFEPWPNSAIMRLKGTLPAPAELARLCRCRM